VQQRQRDVQAFAQVQGGVVWGEAVGVGPEVEGVAGAAAFEAVEDAVAVVDGEAAAGAGSGAVQGTGAALLGAVGGVRPEAKQREDVGHGDSGTDGVEVDGGALTDSGLTVVLLVRGLA